MFLQEYASASLVRGVAVKVPLKTIVGKVQSGRRHYTLPAGFMLGVVVFGPLCLDPT
jgi:hypothetical protein